MLTVPPTPAADGAAGLWPPADPIAAALAPAAAALRKMDFTVAGRPAGELRRLAREELGIAGPEPWIVTGHQSEMHHAGVWFKDAAAAALAEAVGASAMHVVADLDIAREGGLPVPTVGADGLIATHHAPFASIPGGRCPAQLPAPDASTVRALTATAAGGLSEPETFEIWAEHAAAEAGRGSLAEWITRSRAGVNAALGVRIRDAYWSRIVRGPAFACFAADICLRAEGMFAAHGEALREHRRRFGVKNPARPVPDLRRAQEAVEVPLWLFRGSGPREPLYASRVGDGVELRTPAGAAARLPADSAGAAEAIAELAAADVVIAPRALTLTMFLRAFVADLFIHGTGGARYDRLGDALTERWFRWRPPPFAVATATLRLPLPRFEATAADLSRLRWLRHHLRHNPVAPAAEADPIALDGEAADLQREAETLLGRLASAERFSHERARCFARLHEVRSHLREAAAGRLGELSGRIERVRARLIHNAAAESREYFFAFMPRRRLLDLIETARCWAAGERIKAQ